MAGGGGVEDAPLINDPTLITHNRSDWNHSETLMWSELSRTTDGQNPPKTRAANPQSDQCDELHADWKLKCCRGKFDCLPKLCSTRAHLRLLKENCDTISTAVIYSITDISGRHFNTSGTSMKSVLGLKSNCWTWCEEFRPIQGFYCFFI